MAPEGQRRATDEHSAEGLLTLALAVEVIEHPACALEPRRMVYPARRRTEKDRATLQWRWRALGPLSLLARLPFSLAGRAGRFAALRGAPNQACLCEVQKDSGRALAGQGTPRGTYGATNVTTCWGAGAQASGLVVGSGPAAAGV